VVSGGSWQVVWQLIVSGLVRWRHVDHYLSPCSSGFWRSGEVAITVITGGEKSGSCEMIALALWYSLIIIGNCPHVGKWSVLQGSVVS
jgi:hypothetical protein